MWHASISWPNTEGRPVPIEEWTKDQRLLAHRVALRCLDGVGEGPDMWHEGAGVLHLRRRTSVADRDLIDAAWLAEPAVDAGGGEDRITRSWEP